MNLKMVEEGILHHLLILFLNIKSLKKWKKKSLLLKENVSKIHFNNWNVFNELSLDAKNSDSEIIISNSFDNGCFYVYNSKKTKLIFYGEDGNDVLCAEFENADSVFLEL